MAELGLSLQWIFAKYELKVYNPFMEMESKGYSLWLMPKGDTFRKYQEIIRSLADVNGAPRFQPHITLLGETQLPEEEVIRRTEQLASVQPPIQIRLGQIGFEEYHFRALFVRVEKASPLVSLHERAKEIFGMNLPPFMPHLSLLYGKYFNLVKRKIIDELGPLEDKFDVNSVHIVKGGLVEEWKVVREIPFS